MENEKFIEFTLTEDEEVLKMRELYKKTLPAWRLLLMAVAYLLSIIYHITYDYVKNFLSAAKLLL